MPRYNIAPSQPVLVVRQAAPDVAPTAVLSRWGLVPRVAPERKASHQRPRRDRGQPTGVFEMRSRDGRCLVPPTASTSGRERKGRSGSRSTSAWPAAGSSVWPASSSRDRSPAPPPCAILTTAPNAVVEKIHERMPVIVPKADYARWLDPRATPLALRTLLAPYPAARMQSWPVGPAVNNARVDDPACLARL